MLRAYFRRIRMQPRAVRDRHALVIAGVFTGVIASVWFFTQLQSDDAARQVVATEATPPFSNLIQEVKDQWASISAALPETSQEDEVGSTTDVQADQLLLTPETIEQLRQSDTLPTTTVYSDQGRDSVTSAPKAQEVQIVTVPSTSLATTSASSTTP